MVVLAARQQVPVLVATLRRNGIADTTTLTAISSGNPGPVHTMEFDGARDLWRLYTTSGVTTAEVVIVGDIALGGTRIIGSGEADVHAPRPDAPPAHLGTALHLLPNLFWTQTPAGAHWPRYPTAQRAEYAARCITTMRRAGCTRIRVRRAVQYEAGRRWAANPRSRGRMPRPDSGHFDLTVAADRGPACDYAGPAILDAPGTETAVTATLGGHADPIDGRYHWYGRLTAADPDTLPDPGRAAVSLLIPGCPPATGRLQERDPWGNLRIAGIGRPPYSRANIDPR